MSPVSAVLPLIRWTCLQFIPAGRQRQHFEWRNLCVQDRGERSSRQRGRPSDPRQNNRGMCVLLCNASCKWEGGNYWCNDCLHHKEGETPKNHSIFVYVWALSSSWTQCVTYGTWISILAFCWRSRKSILQTVNVSDTILPVDIGDVK